MEEVIKPASRGRIELIESANLPGIAAHDQEKQPAHTSALLFIFPAKQDFSKDALYSQFSSRHKVLVLDDALPSEESVFEYAQDLIPEIEKLVGKRTSIVAYREGCSIAKAICVSEPRLIRRLILIDPQARMKLDLFSRIIDKIEAFLPVGLPMRALSKRFDSRSFLHRLRCPVLVARSEAFNIFLDDEAGYMRKKIPNCYGFQAKNALYQDSRFSDEFVDVLEQLLNTAVKRPQKNTPVHGAL